MKPLSVTMQAFGPYLEKTTVDFTKLGNNPIFLITGATGGGKTTILDAMSFALYCRATGGRRSWSSMRNNQAEESQDTLVDFSFLLGDKAYRFVRSQSVYHVRGSGRTEIREEHACYHMVDGAWSLLKSGRETPVREYAETLLGLNCSQFSQVIMLPQGDFLRLLRSSSTDKADILQTLFDTKFWADVTKIVKAKSDTLAKKESELRASVLAVLQQEKCEDRAQLEEQCRVLEQTLQAETKSFECQQVKWKEEQQKLSQRIAGLESVRAMHLRLERLRKEEEQKRAQLILQKEAEAAAEQKIIVAEQNLQKGNAFIQELQKSIQQLPDCIEQADVLKKAWEQRTACENMEKEIITLQSDVVKANCVEQELTLELQTLRARLAQEESRMREDNAVMLSSYLKEGQPCPVCGSRQHPHPALQSNGFDAQQIELLRKSIEKKEASARRQFQVLAELKTKLEQKGTELQQLKTQFSQIGESGDVSLLKEAEEQLRRLKEQRDKLPRAEQLLKQRETERAAAQQESERIKAQNTALEQEITRLTAAAQELDHSLSSSEASGNLEQLKKQLAHLQQESNRLSIQLGSLQQQHKMALHALKSLNTLETQLQSVDAEYTRASRLALLLSGRNPLKIPLHQFMLGIMLDDILSSANQFFASLSDGRYSLRRLPGSSGGNSLGGLDMEVTDAFSGTGRSIETLSGGEQFLASLSLAFGLSDVVQGYSSTVRLDSIFIDEGFGSLDQETLDTAMKALFKIQKTGRTIGIISHVSELKNRIPARIEVIKKENGTDIRILAE